VGTVEKRKIGSLEVSAIGLGCNTFGTTFFGPGLDRAESKAMVDAAIDNGINMFDTAEEYSVPSGWGDGESEQFLGAALGSRRDQVVIATKFQTENIATPDKRGPERIKDAVDGSLKRLGTDYIDLYQQHNADPDTPIEETLGALDELVQAGKVREIGCSNFNGTMLDDANAAAADRGTQRYVSVQSRYCALEASPPDGYWGPDYTGWLEAAERNDLQIIPFFPLASGVLTGKYNDGTVPPDSRLASNAATASFLAEQELTEENLQIARALEAYARDHGHTLLELAFSWLVSQPRVATVIAGASRPSQIESNVAAGNWKITPDEFSDIRDVVAGVRNG
jgi:aryl-alcohol dehydrogenase-like predicted oxidoreductase